MTLATCKEDESLLLEIRKTMIHFDMDNVNSNQLCEEKAREENAFLFDRETADSSWTEIYSTKLDCSTSKGNASIHGFNIYKDNVIYVLFICTLENKGSIDPRLTQSDVGCGTLTSSADMIPTPPTLSRSRTIDNANIRSKSSV